MAKSLLAAISNGVRPISIKALTTPVSLLDHAFWQQWNGGGSFTGKAVTVDNALKLATVWACVRLISETLATLPLGFYRRNADGSRTSATSHNLYELLHNQPNADMTAVTFWQLVVASMLLWGNAYIEIVRSGATVIALLFLNPERVRVQRLPSGRLGYWCRSEKGGTERPIPEANMMHIPAFTLDGVMGLSPVSYGANVLGTSIETDKASAETFRDAMRSPGIITVDAVMKNEQREMIREHVKRVGAEGGVYVLEKGTGFEKLKFNPVDAELLSSREYNVAEICRWFGLDPVMVGHGNKDSNWGTGLEQKMLWFLIFALRKWCVRIEQAVRKSLLTPVERISFHAEFNMEGLLRGDSAARASWYSTMWQNGGMTRNEGRAKENLPPMDGGDVLTVQSNLIPLAQLGKAPPADNAARDALMAWLGMETDANAKAFDSLRADVRALADRPQPPINVDARTTVGAPAAANVTVNVPEHKAPDVKVEVAAPVVNVSAAAPPNVTVNVPEQKAPDVRVDVAAPVFTVQQPDVTVNIEAASGDQTTTYRRDPETKEILSSTTRRTTK